MQRLILLVLLYLPHYAAFTADAPADAPAAQTPSTISTDISPADDERIRRKILSVFGEIETLADVQVDVNNGVVTLEGRVESASAETQAATLARQVEGVAEVNNALEVNLELESRIESTAGRLGELSRTALSAAPLWALALLILLAGWWFGGWLSRRQTLLGKLAPNVFIASLYGQILRALVLLGALSLALTLLDATALLGTLLGAAGIVGLAVGFAVRDTVENYIASVLLSIRNPFEINDFITIDGRDGNVARLTSRATILISPDGNHIRLPNSLVFKSVIVNHTRNPLKRFAVDIPVTRAQPLAQLQALALKTLQQTDGVLDTPRPLALFEKDDPATLKLVAYGWVDQSHLSFAKVQSEATRRLHQAFAAEGIEAPKTTLDVNINPGPTALTADESASLSGTSAADLRPERAVEKTVLEEQHTRSAGTNLLSESTPNE